MIPSCGRAQLARVLAELGPDLVESAAELTRYELTPGIEPGPDSQQDTSRHTKRVVVPQSAAAVAAPVVAPVRPVEVPFAPQRPKGRFFQVVSATHRDADTHTKPRLSEAPWASPQPARPAAPPVTQPLVPWPRLWRRLRPQLSQRITTQEVDLRQLLRSVARAHPVPALPRQVRFRFSARPLVLVDRTRRQMPFWNDQNLVCTALARWMASDHVRPFFFVEGMNPEAWLRSGAVDFGHGLQGAVILLLGDLGAYGTASDVSAWLRVGQWLVEQGAELRALVPCPAWRLEPAVAALWHAATWDETERQLPPLSATEQQARAERLLTLVSSALRIELGMVREARALLPPAATDSGTEADVLLHPAVIAQSAVGLTLDNTKQNQLRDALERHQAGQVNDLLMHWHRGLTPELLQLEQFELMLRYPELFDADSQRTLTDFMLHTLRAIDEHDAAAEHGVPEGVLAWFTDLEQRLPEWLWQDPIFRRSLLVAWAVAHRDDANLEVPAGIGFRDIGRVGTGQATCAQALSSLAGWRQTVRACRRCLARKRSARAKTWYTPIGLWQPVGRNHSRAPQRRGGPQGPSR